MYIYIYITIIILYGNFLKKTVVETLNYICFLFWIPYIYMVYGDMYIYMVYGIW